MGSNDTHSSVHALFERTALMSRTNFYTDQTASVIILPKEKEGFLSNHGNKNYVNQKEL